MHDHEVGKFPFFFQFFFCYVSVYALMGITMNSFSYVLCVLEFEDLLFWLLIKDDLSSSLPFVYISIQSMDGSSLSFLFSSILI